MSSPWIGVGPCEGSPLVLTSGLLLVSTAIEGLEHGTYHAHSFDAFLRVQLSWLICSFPHITWETCPWLCLILCYLGPQIWAAYLTKSLMETVLPFSVCSSLFYRVTFDLRVGTDNTLPLASARDCASDTHPQSSSQWCPVNISPPPSPCAHQLLPCLVHFISGFKLLSNEYIWSSQSESHHCKAQVACWMMETAKLCLVKIET